MSEPTTVYPTRPSKWDLRFLSLAKHISTWSKDPSTQVGAVIADPDNRITGIGFNGFARGVQDLSERLDDRETKVKMVLHGEENALIFARVTRGCTMFVYPLPPCPHCMSLMAQHRIDRVVMPKVDLKDSSRWSPELSMKIADEVGILWQEVDFV